MPTPASRAPAVDTARQTPLAGHAESIERSHLRCAALGLRRIDRPDFASPLRSELQGALDRNRRLSSQAAPIMELLADQIRETQSMIVLTDALGTILHTVGDNDFMQRADKVALAPGANWAEQCKGTNAIGTALFDEQAVLVHGSEHFMHANGFLTCSAAPIFDPRGNILGVLDVTGEQHSYHPHTMGLVRMSARMIENHWLTEDFKHRMRLHFHSRPEFIGTLMEGIAVVGADGRVLGANRSALDQLAMSGAQIRMQSVTSLFGTSVSALVDHFRSPLPVPLVVQTPGGPSVHLVARFQARMLDADTSAPADAAGAERGMAVPRPVAPPSHPDPSSAGRVPASHAGPVLTLAVGHPRAMDAVDGGATTSAAPGPHRAGDAPEPAPPWAVAAVASPAPPRPRPATAHPAAGFSGLQYLLTGCPQVKAVVDKIRRIVDRDIPLLILGETGTGKELVARAVHHDSQRARQSFVAVNCASIPESLIEAELFGYEDGAFTGARRKGSVGRILQAHGGTLFLDEIGDMPLSLQARLLRVLQERQVSPLGSTRSIPVDVAVIGATHRNLREMIEQGLFREDLYYRLNGLTVRLPPLRDRPDLLAVARRILLSLRPDDPVELSPRVQALFTGYHWPGNIRQLSNVLRTASVMASGEPTITEDHLSDDFVEDLHRNTVRQAPAADGGRPAAPPPTDSAAILSRTIEPPSPPSMRMVSPTSIAPLDVPPTPATNPATICTPTPTALPASIPARAEAAPVTLPTTPGVTPLGASPTTAPNRTLEQIERDTIRQALEAAGGNISVASKRLGISRNTIYRKLRWNAAE